MLIHTYHICDNPYCSTCYAGLLDCIVCFGAEGSLTSECCGRPLTPIEQEEILKGNLDFREGAWIPRMSKHLEGFR